MHNIVIFGASGHGSVVMDCVKKEGEYNFVGYIDSFQKKGREHNGYPILGNEYDLPYLIEKYNIHGGIVAIGDNWIRKIIVERIIRIISDFRFVSTVHPTAIVGMNVEIGHGSVVMPGVIINANSVIGNHCILNTNSSFEHDGLLCDFSSLAPRVCVGGNFILGTGSAICLGTNIIENITIGKYTVIGAGSLVVGNVDSYVLAYGSPVKKIRNRIAGDPYLMGSRGDTNMISLFRHR
ncbi:NeuD/PglB/VioB family sugar acetyltransferase [Ulvibacterium marinum]|uniref:Transferase n=1 Tax=Ulvibacterium marinum TaxID=2419782 RepID=A0A3B0CDW8_9FLAO|nr:NeuD/PglB/VioB family sugar acetyltransferase [Ulvibacterium marinum]RKN83560.1 transferase [Ulvibacterium marinum]